MRILNTIPTLDEIKIDNPNLKAMFWDMDGTLLNTEIIHAKAIFKVISLFKGEVNLELESLGPLIIGKTEAEAFETLLKSKFIKNITYANFVEKKDKLFLEILKKLPVNQCVDEKIVKLIQDCSTSGIELALVTSSEKEIASILLDHFKLRNHFKYFIAREDTAKNKPDPEPYLSALKQSNLSNSEVLIFEDSQVGLEAARLSHIPFCQVNWY